MTVFATIQWSPSQFFVNLVSVFSLNALLIIHVLKIILGHDAKVM